MWVCVPIIGDNLTIPFAAPFAIWSTLYTEPWQDVCNIFWLSVYFSHFFYCIYLYETCHEAQ